MAELAVVGRFLFPCEELEGEDMLLVVCREITLRNRGASGKE